jgi:hypothetical protein
MAFLDGGRFREQTDEPANAGCQPGPSSFGNFAGLYETKRETPVRRYLP